MAHYVNTTARSCSRQDPAVVLARALERERIGRLSEALEHERFVGVTCEAEAGKTHVLAAVAHEQAGGQLRVLRVTQRRLVCGPRRHESRLSRPSRSTTDAGSRTRTLARGFGLPPNRREASGTRRFPLAKQKLGRRDLARLFGR